MTDHKKEGAFGQWQREDEGGDKKQHKIALTTAAPGGRNSGHGGPR